MVDGGLPLVGQDPELVILSPQLVGGSGPSECFCERDVPGGGQLVF